MAVVAILDLDAQATAARYLPPARAWLRALHDDAEVTYGQTEERAAELAGRPEFRAAVDAGRVDVVRELEVLRRRVAAIVALAARVDPHNAGRVAVFLRQDVVLTLGNPGDEGSQRREAMLFGPHPAGREMRPATLNDFTE